MPKCIFLYKTYLRRADHKLLSTFMLPPILNPSLDIVCVCWETSWSGTIWLGSMVSKHCLHGLSGILGGWQQIDHPSIHHSFSEIPRTFSSLQPPSLCPDRWWEEGGGSVINNANLALAQKHYCEGNEKEKIMDKIPNRQEWKSLDYSLCRWSCSHRQTKNRISFCLRGATWWRWRLFLCVWLCVCQSSLWSQVLGSRNTNGQQLRFVALFEVNERDGGRVTTKEGLRGKTRVGCMLHTQWGEDLWW